MREGSDAREHLEENASKGQMSLRLSAGLPLACSGAIYAAVPSNVPTPVIIAGDVIVGDNDPSGRLKPAPTFGA